jgi:hypothetical protein
VSRIYAVGGHAARIEPFVAEMTEIGLTADEIDAVRHQLEFEIVLDGPPHARFDWIAQKHGIAPSDINFGLVHPLRPARRSLGVFR